MMPCLVRDTVAACTSCYRLISVADRNTLCVCRQHLHRLWGS